jgi:hypothetical protein
LESGPLRGSPDKYFKLTHYRDIDDMAETRISDV